MAEYTKISWATHTFNPWIGCSKVHAGCANCYAEAMAGRFGVTWGPNGTRRRTAASAWKQVEKWNRRAGCQCGNPKFDGGTCDTCIDGPPSVFPSLCDPFEDWGGPVADWQRGVTTMQTIREDFFALIDRTPNLDWLLLTKRPENVRRMWRESFLPDLLEGSDDTTPTQRPNVWLLYSASDQATLESGLPHLLACRDLVPVVGLSLEPLIGPVAISGDVATYCHHAGRVVAGECEHGLACRERSWLDYLDWVIVGCEQLPGHKPGRFADGYEDAARSLIRQCRDAGVRVFHKQMPVNGRVSGDPSEWPEDLRVREFPGIER